MTPAPGGLLTAGRAQDLADWGRSLGDSSPFAASRDLEVGEGLDRKTGQNKLIVAYGGLAKRAAGFGRGGQQGTGAGARRARAPPAEISPALSREVVHEEEQLWQEKLNVRRGTSASQNFAALLDKQVCLSRLLRRASGFLVSRMKIYLAREYLMHRHPCSPCMDLSASHCFPRRHSLTVRSLCRGSRSTSATSSRSSSRAPPRQHPASPRLAPPRPARAGPTEPLV